MKDPPGDDGIEHQQDIVARDGKVPHDMPFASFRLQFPAGGKNTLPGGAAHGVFHRHYRNAQDHQEQQVDQNKKASAVLSRHVRKTPYVFPMPIAQPAESRIKPRQLPRVSRAFISLFPPLSSFF